MHILSILKTAFVFFSVLSVLVIVHEWGHFIVAKLCGMRVDDFSLFFGKRIWRIGNRNGTEYNVRAIPLGGFVKIAGMEPEDITMGSYVQKPGSKKNARLLAGLSFAELSDVDERKISNRVSESIYNAIGTDTKLTQEGRGELETLVGAETTNESERRYLQTVLDATPRPPDPRAYNQKPLLQRAAVIFAGPLASLLFGYLIFCVMGSTTGLPQIPDKDDKTEAIVGMVVPGKVAAKAGMKTGDKILSINQTPVSSWKELVTLISANPERQINVSALRGTETIRFQVTPVAEQITEEENGKKVEKKVGRLGIGISPIWRRYDSPLISIKQGTSIIAYQVQMIFTTIFSRHASENLSGPIGIAGQMHSDSQGGVNHILLTAAQLSVSLGVMNLLPIPILDGGHLVLLALEGIRRRKLSFQEFLAAQKVGIFIIGTLFILVMYNDIKRLFFKG